MCKHAATTNKCKSHSRSTKLNENKREKRLKIKKFERTSKLSQHTVSVLFVHNAVCYWSVGGVYWGEMWGFVFEVSFELRTSHCDST